MGDGGRRRGTEYGTYGVVVAEAEAESIGFVQVDGVGIKDPDIHLPFFKVVGGNEADAWGKGLMDLGMRESEELDSGKCADVDLPC